jgi:hypothetical protein
MQQAWPDALFGGMIVISVARFDLPIHPSLTQNKPIWRILAHPVCPTTLHNL